LPPDLEALLLRCLARDPAERPHDAFAVHDALADIVRRCSGTGSIATPRLPSEPPAEPREPNLTVFDRPAAPGHGTSADERGVTREMSSRWSTALADLEAHIAEARRSGGPHARAAGRAAELALVAGEMVPRVERAARVVGELQARVDRLEAEGREFRTNLGHAIDVLVHDRSRERAHLDALKARRRALERAMADVVGPILDGPLSSPGGEAAPLSPSPSRGGSDPRAWEVEALGAEAARAASVDADLAFQLEALQRTLDTRNEEFERQLVQATGQLEGSLSALRQLTREIVRTIDDGIGILQRAG
jgi:hypothetical protein